MKVTETKIPGVLIIDTDVFGDHRGYLRRRILSLNMKRWVLQ